MSPYASLRQRNLGRRGAGCESKRRSVGGRHQLCHSHCVAPGKVKTSSCVTPSLHATCHPPIDRVLLPQAASLPSLRWLTLTRTAGTGASGLRNFEQKCVSPDKTNNGEAQRATSIVAIMPLSSCDNRWQWYTNLPTMTGSVNGMTTFTSPCT